MGIDLSLTGTGLSILERKTKRHKVRCALSTIKSSGKKTDTLLQRYDRLRRIAQALTHVSHPDGIDLIVIEAPSYGSKHGSQHDRSGLWWSVVSGWIESDVPVATVAPTARAKYATGKGNADKDKVLASVVRRYVCASVDNNNEADALVLAAMGMRWLGMPIDDVPQTNLEAMEKGGWPEWTTN